MKVTLIGPVYPYRGGIAHYTTQLAVALQSEGHGCEIISFRRQYPAWLYPGSSDKDPSRSAKHVDADYLLDPLFPWTWVQSASRIIQQQPDLVVLQWWTTYWAMPFAYLAKRLHHHHIPLVYIVHNVLPHEEKFFDRWFAKIALSGANGFIVQTSREKERLLLMLPQAVVYISPHPAYTMFVNQRINKIEARQALGLPLDQYILLFFGIVRPYKGLKFLIEALSILRREGKTPYLLVAGDFWEDYSIYERQIEAAGLSRQILVDNRYIPDEEAALMFSAVDALIAPYVGGTQSGVAGIALGFGLPMVVTEQIAAGIGEYDSRLMEIIPPADAYALAKAIGTIISYPIGELTENAMVQDNWWKLVESLVEVHRQIVEE